MKNEIIITYEKLLEKSKGICLLHLHLDVGFFESICTDIPKLSNKTKHIYFEVGNFFGNDDIPTNKNPDAIWWANKVLRDGGEIQESRDISTTFWFAKLILCLADSDKDLFLIDDPNKKGKTSAQRNEYMIKKIGVLSDKLSEDDRYIVITGFLHYPIADALVLSKVLCISEFYFNENPYFQCRGTQISPNLETPIIKQGQFVELLVEDLTVGHGYTIVDTLIVIPTSRFQNHHGKFPLQGFIYPSAWNIAAPEIIEVLEKITSKTGLGISLAIEKTNFPNHNKLFRTGNSSFPCIRLSLLKRDLSDDLFKKIIVAILDQLSSHLAVGITTLIDDEKIILSTSSNYYFKLLITDLRKLLNVYFDAENNTDVNPEIIVEKEQAAMLSF